jgi:hypothetical protein
MPGARGIVVNPCSASPLAVPSTVTNQYRAASIVTSRAVRQDRGSRMSLANHSDDLACYFAKFAPARWVWSNDVGLEHEEIHGGYSA